MRCWSYSPTFNRCEREDEHTEHEFTVRETWGDAESWVPVRKPDAYTTTPTPIPIYEIPADPVPIDECAICGCPERDHGREGCEDHDCKAFVP